MILLKWYSIFQRLEGYQFSPKLLLMYQQLMVVVPGTTTISCIVSTDWYLSQPSVQPLRPTSGGPLFFFISLLKHVEGLTNHPFWQTISLVRVP